MTPDSFDAIKAALPSNYSIDGLVKGGGQGSVFTGTVDGKPAAIKLYDPTADAKRLEREIEILVEIDCPTLVKVLATANIQIESINRAVVAYEFHDGGDLVQFCNGSTQLDYELLLRVAIDVSAALSELWKKRVVHRDVKPANIVKTNDSPPKFILVDVGLAKLLDRSNITAPGLAPGTPGYMSPEQARGRRHLTKNSDIFSLGITLYELATQKHPFQYNQRLIGTTSPRPIRSIRDDIPTPLSRLIHQMLEVRPANRPTNLFDQFNELMEH